MRRLSVSYEDSRRSARLSGCFSVAFRKWPHPKHRKLCLKLWSCSTHPLGILYHIHVNVQKWRKLLLAKEEVNKVENSYNWPATKLLTKTNIQPNPEWWPNWLKLELHKLAFRYSSHQPNIKLFNTTVQTNGVLLCSYLKSPLPWFFLPATKPSRSVYKSLFSSIYLLNLSKCESSSVIEFVEVISIFCQRQTTLLVIFSQLAHSAQMGQSGRIDKAIDEVWSGLWGLFEAKTASKKYLKKSGCYLNLLSSSFRRLSQSSFVNEFQKVILIFCQRAQKPNIPKNQPLPWQPQVY